MADFDGRPSVRNRPRDKGDGTVLANETGPDRLLRRLRAVHGDARYDFAPELEILNVGLAR
jgi:hypothetical protein